MTEAYEIKWVDPAKVFSNLTDWLCSSKRVDHQALSDGVAYPAPALPIFEQTSRSQNEIPSQCSYLVPRGVFSRKEDKVLLIIPKDQLEIEQWISLYLSFYQKRFFDCLSERAALYHFISVKKCADDITKSDLNIQQILVKEEPYYSFYLGLKTEVQQWLSDCQLPMRVFKRVYRLGETDLLTLAQYMPKWSLSRSEQLLAIEWICDIHFRDKQPLDSWFEDVQTSHEFKCLYQRRYPKLSEKESTFSKLKSELGSKKWTITPPSKYWDGSHYYLSTKVKNLEDLQDKINDAAKMVQHNAFRQLFELFKLDA